MTQEQKAILKITIIFDAITTAIYGIYLFIVGGGVDWLKEKVNESKERRLKRKEAKYATKIVGFEEEES